MDVQKAGSPGFDRQRHFNEVDCADGRAIVGIFDQLLGNLEADIGLGLLGRAADMGRQDDIGQVR